MIRCTQALGSPSSRPDAITPIGRRLDRREVVVNPYQRSRISRQYHHRQLERCRQRGCVVAGSAVDLDRPPVQPDHRRGVAEEQHTQRRPVVVMRAANRRISARHRRSPRTRRDALRHHQRSPWISATQAVTQSTDTTLACPEPAPLQQFGRAGCDALAGSRPRSSGNATPLRDRPQRKPHRRAVGTSPTPPSGLRDRFSTVPTTPTGLDRTRRQPRAECGRGSGRGGGAAGRAARRRRVGRHRTRVLSSAAVPQYLGRTVHGE